MAAKSSVGSDTVHSTLPGPGKVTALVNTNFALTSILLSDAMEVRISTAGLVAGIIVTETDAVADRLVSETRTENVEVVPKVCLLAIKTSSYSCKPFVVKEKLHFELCSGAV